MSPSETYTDTGPTSVFYQGVDAERERIVKLIEEASVINADQKFFLVRSIKGEQK
jgi:hypothetical protein